VTGVVVVDVDVGGDAALDGLVADVDPALLIVYVSSSDVATLLVLIWMCVAPIPVFGLLLLL
jgi:hypothetical protein